ncbi:unnamed protein product [Dicrocoelium dendriticum]|nr:unnamed protein product [Dicrocoelium dendriticum]
MVFEVRPGSLLYVAGTVVHGFGRGSKQLGIPTANLDPYTVSQLPSSVTNGIYFAWAKVDEHPIAKSVVSIGWNPYFKNSTRSVEAHIMRTFQEDFYGSVLHLLLLKYHRPERDFNSLSNVFDIRRTHPGRHVLCAAAVHGCQC